MRVFFWVMFSCLAFTEAQAASFDCSKARSSTEKMICGDAELSRLDEAMGLAYRQALQNAERRQAVMKSQRLWLKKVSNTCNDAPCMKQAYQSRITELGNASSFHTGNIQDTPHSTMANRPSELPPKFRLPRVA